ADARPLVPAGAARAAAVRPLAAGGPAQALLADGRRGRLGGDLAAAPRRAGGPVRPGGPGALRGAGQELGVRQPVSRLMSLLRPLITRNSSSTMPTELSRDMAMTKTTPPRSFPPR